jgi:hypothetical protein
VQQCTATPIRNRNAVTRYLTLMVPEVGNFGAVASGS